MARGDLAENATTAMNSDPAVAVEEATGATLDDVAREAGVSPATVSRCLNSPEIVRPALKAKVEAAIAKLDYVPHGAARSLASRRSRMIGAIFPSLDSALFGGALEALQSEIAGSGYTLVVASSNYDPERERSHLRNMLASGIDALMLVGGARDDSLYRLIARRKVPYVLTWVAEAGGAHPCIGFDNYAAATAVTRHLLELGHRRFAGISGSSQSNDRAAARLDGIRAALAEQGLALAPDLVIERPFDIEEGREGLRLLMSKAPRPTAVICGSDPFAYGALFECQDLGLQVPGDISITGFDDMSLSASLAPGLTTVRTPRKEMGTLAGRYLLSVLDGHERPPPGPLGFKLVLRGSSGPPPGSSN